MIIFAMCSSFFSKYRPENIVPAQNILWQFSEHVSQD
jgi:hypothetical protein